MYNITCPHIVFDLFYVLLLEHSYVQKKKTPPIQKLDNTKKLKIKQTWVKYF